MDYRKTEKQIKYLKKLIVLAELEGKVLFKEKVNKGGKVMYQHDPRGPKELELEFYKMLTRAIQDSKKPEIIRSKKNELFFDPAREVEAEKQLNEFKHKFSMLAKKAL